MTRVLVPNAEPPLAVLPAGEAHHVGRVLRLRVGDALVVFDGIGHEWDARLRSLDRNAASVELLAARVPVRESAIAITLGVALLKGDQMDHVVRDATALGVRTIVPCATAHVAIGDQARQARSIERWRRVALAAAKQCGRAVVPAVDATVPLTDVLERHRAFDRIVACVEPSRQVSWPGVGGEAPARALVLIGPEGGWAEAELLACRDAGACRLDLGPRTLRADLAPVVALSVLQQIWGWR